MTPLIEKLTQRFMTFCFLNVCFQARLTATCTQKNMANQREWYENKPTRCQYTCTGWSKKWHKVYGTIILQPYITQSCRF